ncbi:MAG TPA: enoyl-CoA hydratase-related protein, partial [Allocoleopsis sp.]
VTSGAIGAKAGQGFYKKQKGEILSVNPEAMSYEPAKPMDLGEVEKLGKLPHLRDRLQALYQDSGRAGQFFRTTTLDLLGYSARRVPEIADSPADIDRAMRWGFGWDVGPFEIWEMLGFETVLADMKAANISVPDWVETMHRQGEGFGDKHSSPSQGVLAESSTPTVDKIDLGVIKADPQRTLWQNAEAALLDLGDGVALYEFRSKGNTLSFKVVEGLSEVLDLLETRDDLKGMVIGNGSDHFSGGANLAEMGMTTQSGNLQALDDLIVQFQSILQRIRYAPKPVVIAMQGRALGGGCELVMACPHVVAAAESYIGLVELGVGLIPGAGGIMRSVARVAERAASDSAGDIQPFLKAAFETIAMAKVSSSAYEAQQMGYLPCDARILISGENRLEVAKAEVLHLDRAGYAPPPEQTAIMVLGRPARAMLEHIAYVFQQGGFASEYDRYLAGKLAYVMTGGELSAPTLVHEDYLLRLERENFLPLLSQPKTQERIAHMLKTKKPLRN